MSKRETFALKSAQPADLFTSLTAEAWLDPDLAGRLARDRAGTVAAFARDYGYAIPSDERIMEFELAANPIGSLELHVRPETMDTTAEYSCNSAAPGCNSNNGTCPSPSYNCVTTINNCSFDCPTAHCTMDPTCGA